MSLSIVETRIGDIVVLGLSGAVDMSTLPRLSDALIRVIADGARDVAVDLDGITVLDDAALGILLGASARLTSIGGSLFLVVNHPKMRAYIHSTRLDQLVPLHSSVGEIRARA